MHQDYQGSFLYPFHQASVEYGESVGRAQTAHEVQEVRNEMFAYANNLADMAAAAAAAAAADAAVDAALVPWEKYVEDLWANIRALEQGNQEKQKLLATAANEIRRFLADEQASKTLIQELRQTAQSAQAKLQAVEAEKQALARQLAQSQQANQRLQDALQHHAPAEIIYQQQIEIETLEEKLNAKNAVEHDLKEIVLHWQEQAHVFEHQTLELQAHLKQAQADSEHWKQEHNDLLIRYNASCVVLWSCRGAMNELIQSDDPQLAQTVKNVFREHFKEQVQAIPGQQNPLEHLHRMPKTMKFLEKMLGPKDQWPDEPAQDDNPSPAEM
jgi:chromosome segregation ATPase